jgi:hypothetical protein
MGFGYNKYLTVLAALSVAGVGIVGCSDSSSKRGSSVAAATSGTTAGSTSSTTSASTLGPQLTGAAFVDVDGDKMLSKGDKITLSFDADVAAIQTAADPSKEILLAVGGDTFGTGATIQNATSPKQLEIVLGDAAILRVSAPFDIGKTTPGASSGLNVSYAPSIKGVDSSTIRPAMGPVDVDGTLQAGFMQAGSLNKARGGHAAVTLDDGRVLIVGGAAAKGKGGYVAEAELFDPLTKSFSVVSDLTGDDGYMRRGKIKVRMTNVTAVKLTDGTVLVCGGIGIEKKSFFGLGSEKVDTLESAFLFDPTTNTFSQVGDMAYARHSHTATLMDDGRVAIAGGYNDSFWKKNKTQAPVEIYDPAKKAFEKLGSFISRTKTVEPRMNHSATAIEGGTGILLVGGNYYKGGGFFGLIKPKLQMTKGSEVYRTTKSEKAGDLNAPRMGQSAQLVTPREVLIAGGYDPNGIMGSLELYDSATGAWSTVGSLATTRTGCKIAMDKNEALIIGGTTGTGDVDTVEVFNADSKTMSKDSFKLSTARNGHSVSKLKDGRIMVIGGFSGGTSLDGMDGAPISSAEVFVRQ